MIRKQIVYKRKLRGFFLLFTFFLLLFVGVFGICFGIWFFLHSQIHILTPLPKNSLQKNSSNLSSKIQLLCIENKLQCTDITVNNDNTATITIGSDEKVIFSLQKDLNTQIASLQLTIRALTIEGKRFHLLDFRFDKPVITY